MLHNLHIIELSLSISAALIIRNAWKLANNEVVSIYGLDDEIRMGTLEAVHSAE
jgi:hypothetical protein